MLIRVKKNKILELEQLQIVVPEFHQILTSYFSSMQNIALSMVRYIFANNWFPNS